MKIKYEPLHIILRNLSTHEINVIYIAECHLSKNEITKFILSHPKWYNNECLGVFSDHDMIEYKVESKTLTVLKEA